MVSKCVLEASGAYLCPEARLGPLILAPSCTAFNVLSSSFVQPLLRKPPCHHQQVPLEHVPSLLQDKRSGNRLQEGKLRAS